MNPALPKKCKLGITKKSWGIPPLLKNMHKLSDERKGGVKKKLLKAPQNAGEIIFLPPQKEFLKTIHPDSIIATAHQPYFFHPGISVKFLFLEKLPQGKKKIIFLDTDRIELAVKIPAPDVVKIVGLLNTDSILADYPTPEKENFERFFDEVGESLKRVDFGDYNILTNFSRFKDIFLQNCKHRLLKEVLVLSFLQFYEIKDDFSFLSDLIKGKEFKELVLKIYRESKKFQEVFNLTLDEYRQNFRFRYKNFPFPKLADDELPFWAVKEGRRIRCFKKDIEPERVAKIGILPRAVTLTIFLRLYKTDFFIHGIGGANYEWVQDRIIERFFKQLPPLYAVTSGTFLIKNFAERDFPYFLFSAQDLKERAGRFGN